MRENEQAQPNTMTEQHIPYADFLKAQEQEESFLPLDEAHVVAHATKWRREEAAAHRAEAASHEGRGVIKGVKRHVAQHKARNADRLADQHEARVEASIADFHEAKWYAPAKSLYGRAVERARALGDNKLATELQRDFEMTPSQAVDRTDWQERSPIAKLVERVSLVLASPNANQKDRFTLTQGQPIYEYNLFVRATSGKGAQGEGDADLLMTKKAFAVLGMEDANSIPDAFDETGHFGLTWNRFKHASMFEERYTPKTVFEDPSGRVEVKAVYVPESTRSVGEEVSYSPDRVDITISKHPPKQSQ